MPRARDPRWRAGLRFGVSLALLLAAATGLVFVATFWFATQALFRNTNQALVEQLELLSARPPDLLPFMVLSRMHHQPVVTTFVGLFDPDGTLIVGDLDTIPHRMKLDGNPRILTVHSGGVAVSMSVAGRVLPDQRRLVVGRDVSDLVVARRGLLTILAFALVGCIAIGVAAGAIHAVRSQHRLQLVNVSAQRILDGALDERLHATPRGDVIDELCGVMNGLLSRLESLVLGWKSVGENIAHELRTPLTAIRAQLERVRDGGRMDHEDRRLVERAIAGIDRLKRLTSRLLRIMEIERAQQGADFADVDLSALIEEVGADFAPLAEDMGMTLAVQTPGPAIVRGDRELLAEAFVNLTENAIKYAGADRHIRLMVERREADIVASVSDDGAGIPPSERALIFGRFYRGLNRPSVSGSGLGLSLVASIARHHDFDLRVAEAGPGCRIDMICRAGRPGLSQVSSLSQAGS